ncbi:Sir2 family NAD-dependent protein deacetylase [Agrococcus sp. BE272]|uniref:Sir2 family NAD-dependent protein deacetylase n=1 Tax=Agrococcus sp. BE272 TaxID=2817727 RepID=UPI00286216EF|nr:Sir2 family NAD-dependent protein deacetylase [Agrococcus sp. BE272]MDR7234700.1 NAD-dependent SIR2 family protein deacetylase [Agrococcus sp. BE272]
MLDTAIDLLRGRRIAVLTGAGISTDSGIPDYRGEGAPRRTPMVFDTFLSSEDARRRYWAGSHLGWRSFASVHPNDGHRALAHMEEAGLITGIATQNVDDLHERAGSANVTHVHGRLHTVSCLRCGRTFDRHRIADEIERLNPWIAMPEQVRLQPDGDVEIDASQEFQVPSCPVCGGMLKPDVVFFGETVPPQVFAEARDIIAAGDAVLVAGSSLVVNSGTRLLEVARRADVPIVIVNRGETRWDARSAVRVEGGTSETLSAIADALIAPF